jgi:hypothetical protein
MAEWRRLVGLGLPCLLTWAVDVGLTLDGQPPEYWAGDYARTTEGAAFHRRLYARHPAAGVAGQALWLGVAAGLLVLLPETPAVVVALAAVFGNTFGAATWVTAHLVASAAWRSPGPVTWYQASCGLFLGAAVAAGIGVRWVVRAGARAGPAAPDGRSGRRRRVAIAVLLAAGGAIVFGPW